MWFGGKHRSSNIFPPLFSTFPPTQEHDLHKYSRLREWDSTRPNAVSWGVYPKTLNRPANTPEFHRAARAEESPNALVKATSAKISLLDPQWGQWPLYICTRASRQLWEVAAANIGLLPQMDCGAASIGAVSQTASRRHNPLGSVALSKNTKMKLSNWWRWIVITRKQLNILIVSSWCDCN